MIGKCVVYIESSPWGYKNRIEEIAKAGDRVAMVQYYNDQWVITVEESRHEDPLESEAKVRVQ